MGDQAPSPVPAPKILAMKAQFSYLPNTQAKPQPQEYTLRVGCACVRSWTRGNVV